MRWIEEGLASREFRLAESAGFVVGCLRLQKSDPVFWGERDDTAAYIHSLTIDRALAGRGIGGLVLDSVASEARRCGAECLRLDCGERVTGLRRYYESCGFRAVGECVVDGEHLTLYERPLHGSANEPAVRVRAFEVSDAPAVTSLIHRTIDACYQGAYPPRAVAFFKRYHASERVCERHRAGRVIVVEQQGAIVATGSLVVAEISGVFVDPAHQGLGLGRRLMEELESIARAAGVAATELSVSLPSRGFYERCGYQVTENETIDLGAGDTLDYWLARKNL